MKSFCPISKNELKSEKYYNEPFCENCNLPLDIVKNCVIDEDGFITMGTTLMLYNGRKAEVVIPNMITCINEFAFCTCDWITSVTIPDSVICIRGEAFYACENLTSISLPKNLKYIDLLAFSECSSLKTIHIPASVKKIALPPFAPQIGNNFLQFHFTIDKDNPIYSDGNIGNCIIDKRSNTLIFGNKNGTIPYGVETIGENAFAGYENLESIDIPESVTIIEKKAFRGCTNLRKISIPKSVIYIGENAFADTAWFDNLPDGITYINNVLFTKKGELTDEEITVKIGTVSISANAFKSEKIKKISIPDSIINIGKSAFMDCDELITVSLRHTKDSKRKDYPKEYKKIEKCAFSNCSKLMSISLPDNIKKIDKKAFFTCSSLDSIKLPNNLENIGINAFSSCDSLSKIILPDTVKTIDYEAFYNSGLESFTFPNNIEYIGHDAFRSTPWYQNQPVGPIYFNDILYAYNHFNKANDGKFFADIKEFEIKKGTTKIESYALGRCVYLSSITFPSSLKRINCNAFSLKLGIYGISNLNITFLQNYSSGCVYINNILFKYKGILPEHSNICIREKTESICAEAFISQSTLESVIIPNSVEHIGNKAFAHCKNLVSVTIPKSVTSMENDIFFNCEKVTLYVEEDSYAYEYALSNNLRFSLVTESNMKKITDYSP